MVNWKLLSSFRRNKSETPNHEAAAAQWLKEYVEASKLADGISKMLSEHGSYLPSGLETQMFQSSLRRRITILNTRLGKLEADLANLPRKSVSEKQMHKWHEKLSDLRKGEKQMAMALGMGMEDCTSYKPEDLPGSSTASANEVKPTKIWSDRAKGLAGVLDDQHIVNIQREIIKKQDEVLDGLGESALITKQHLLALNEELNLHTRLLDNWDRHDEQKDARLQRIQNRLAILNKRSQADSYCICLLLSAIAIVILIVIAWKLWKHWNVIKSFLKN